MPATPSAARGRNPGVTEWTITAADAGARLDRFLAEASRLGSRRRVSVALERGQVFFNGGEAGLPQAATRLSPGDIVRLWLDRPGSAARVRRRPTTVDAVRILYEDASLLVVNKPSGLLAVPLERREDADSVQAVLERHMRSHGKRRPFVVHRIDRDTSGLVVFAKDAQAQHRLKDQFRRREPERVYLAVVYGHPDPPAGTWRDHLVWDRKALIQKATSPTDPSGTEAVCDYRVVEPFAATALIEVRLQTGKRNQIRLQARLRGHTLVGETRYVYGPSPLRPVAFPRQALHAWRLAFRHPADDRLLSFEAPPPSDFEELLAELRRGRA